MKTITIYRFTLGMYYQLGWKSNPNLDDILTLVKTEVKEVAVSE